MAPRYRKIDPRIWTDEKFCQLKGEEQRIALYILTAQSNRIGLFMFTHGEAIENLLMSAQRFRKGFQKVCETLNWEWDAGARVIYLPTWWRYNQPENANSVLADAMVLGMKEVQQVLMNQGVAGVQALIASRKEWPCLG